MDELFLDRLKIAIQKSGLSQRKFAEASGITAGYLTDILKGRTVPSERVLRGICAGHKLSETWLLTGNESMRPDMVGDSFERYTTQPVEDWRKAGSLPSDYEMIVLDMLRQIGDKERRRIVRFIRNAHDDEIGENTPTE